ncbi:MAG: hypothetical protein AAGG56_06835 [Pseudomonadota bacterium]
MLRCRIHLTGAAGSGVTTLGQAVARSFAVPHHDTDDFYWVPSDPPYRHRRPIHERLRLMQEMFLSRPAWILSGSLEGWGNSIADQFDLVVFVRTRSCLRLERLRRREALRHGFREIRGTWPVLPDSEPFLRWAAEYDTGGLSIRSLQRHEIWLSQLSCPVVTVDGGQAISVSLQAITQAFEGQRTVQAVSS